MTEIKREKNGYWQKGQSGNPSGRPSKTQKVLDDVSGEDLSSIMSVMIKKAIGGDTTAAKIVLDRFIPTLKQTEQNTNISADSGIEINVNFKDDKG